MASDTVDVVEVTATVTGMVVDAPAPLSVPTMPVCVPLPIPNGGLNGLGWEPFAGGTPVRANCAVSMVAPGVPTRNVSVIPLTMITRNCAFADTLALLPLPGVTVAKSARAIPVKCGASAPATTASDPSASINGFRFRVRCMRGSLLKPCVDLEAALVPIEHA